MEFYIFKTKISISFLFPMVIGVLIVGDTSKTISYILWGIFFHEVGHLTMMKIVGKKLKSIHFSACGINIKVNPLKITVFSSIMIHIMGPVFNLVIYFIASICGNQYMASVNLLLALFHLLPILGLDGGNVLSLILLKNLRVSTANLLSQKISYIFIYAIIVIGIGLLYITKSNFTLIALGIALYISVKKGDFAL